MCLRLSSFRGRRPPGSDAGASLLPGLPHWTASGCAHGCASSQRRPWTLMVLVANHPARLGTGLGAKKAWKETWAV